MAIFKIKKAIAPIMRGVVAVMITLAIGWHFQSPDNEALHETVGNELVGIGQEGQPSEPDLPFEENAEELYEINEKTRDNGAPICSKPVAATWSYGSILAAILVIIVFFGARWRVVEARKDTSVGYKKEIDSLQKIDNVTTASYGELEPTLAIVTPLYDTDEHENSIAEESDDYEMVDVAIQATDMDISKLNSELLDSAYNGFVDKVKYLVGQGAEIDARDKDGETPLMWAAQNGHSAIVKYLVKQGADILAEDYAGNAVITFAEDVHIDIANYIFTKILRRMYVPSRT